MAEPTPLTLDESLAAMKWAREVWRTCPVPRLAQGMMLYAVSRGNIEPERAFVRLMVQVASLGSEAVLEMAPDKALATASILATAAMRHNRMKRQSPTDVKKMAYLEALKDTCSLEAARTIVGIGQTVPYTWARNDGEFKAQFNEARKFAGKGPLA